MTGNDDKRGVRGRHRGLLFGALSLSLLACTPNGGGDAGPDGGLRSPPVFPADFAETYTVARPCFLTHEHELRYVQVFADALAYPTYTEFEDPYPVGATIVKIEYDSPDGCEDITQLTAMKKLAAGENTPGGDWWWQQVSPDRRVLEEGAPFRCINCHTEHCEDPYGYDLTCKPEAAGF